MKRMLAVALAMVTCLGGINAIAEEAKKEEVKKVPASGAELGAWTQDYDAVLKLAKEKNLPIFINFTGSDWCGWCKLMDSKVFSTDEWKKFAAENLALAFIDFPRDKSLVPEKFTERNKKLSEQFEVRGYPTYILLASDGKTKLGQLGASREATPEKFIKEVKDTVERPAKIAALTGEKKAGYEKAKAEYEAAEKTLKAWVAEQQKKSEALQKEFRALQEKVDAAEEKMESFLK